MIDYRFSGKQNAHKVIKTIDISEESYKAIKGMLENGVNKTEDVNSPLIEDAYHIFGGNCYDMLVSMAVENLISAIVHELENKEFLCMEGSGAFLKITDTIFPIMCYTSDEDGATSDELRFFEQDRNAICAMVRECLAKDQADIFVRNFTEAIKDDERPAGEVALGILMYIASESISENKETVN